LSVSRLLLATTYKRGTADVIRSGGGVRQESVSDQLCLAMHAAVTKVRRGSNGSNSSSSSSNRNGNGNGNENGSSTVADRALNLLNVVISIDMGLREREKLLVEIQRLMKGDRWNNHQWELRGTEMVQIVCLLGGKGEIFMSMERVRMLVVSVSKAVLSERTSAFLWRQISIVRMMVRLSGQVLDHRVFWSLLRGPNVESMEGEYPLLGQVVGLLKQKMQERAGLVRREEFIWRNGSVGGSKNERENRESAAALEDVLIIEGLKMLERVEILGKVVGGPARQTLGGRLGEETFSLLKLCQSMGMATHLKRSTMNDLTT